MHKVTSQETTKSWNSDLFIWPKKLGLVPYSMNSPPEDLRSTPDEKLLNHFTQTVGYSTIKSL